MLDQIQKNTPLYSYELGLTSITGYGISLLDVLSNNRKIPVDGVRQDVHFSGTIKGDKINGIIEGIDYMYIYPDATIELNIFATITTIENKNIALQATGVALNTQTPGMFNVKQDIALQSNEEEFTWLNGKCITGEGQANLQDKKVLIQAFY